jgi:protein FrlC
MITENQKVDIHRIAGMNYYYRNYSRKYMLNAIKNNGIQNIELWTCPQHYFVSNDERENTKILQKDIQKLGLNIICITPQQGNPNPFNLAAKGKKLIEGTFNYFKNIIKTASELNVKYVSINPGWDYYDEPITSTWKRSIDMCKRIAKYAQSYGVGLVLEALQPNESHLVNSIGDLYRYLSDVGHKNIFVNIDLGAMARSHETIEQYFYVLGDNIRHCHFVDGDPVGHKAWGCGTRNPGKDFEIFNKYDYKGYFTFEFARSTYFEDPKVIEENAILNLKPYFL